VKPIAVKFFEEPSKNAIIGPCEHRQATLKDDARYHTGYSAGSRKANVGIFVVPRANGLARIGFDLIRIDVNLRAAAIEELRARWTTESANLSKQLFKSVSRRSHFSKTFAEFEVEPRFVVGWKRKLTAVFSDGNNLEHIRP